MSLNAHMAWPNLLVLTPLLGLAITMRAAEPTPSPALAKAPSAFIRPALPYAQEALAPYISAATMNFHYGKHHQGYVDTLNKLVAGTPWAGQTLEKIVVESAGMPDQVAVFNNAAQAWNHDFFWRSMKPGGGGPPAGRLLQMLESSFGGYEPFKAAFLDAAAAQFGSGWVWLVQEGDMLRIVKTSNADTPIAHGQAVLLTCDVWEHAYYLDFQNRRKEFVVTFLDHLVNWDFAAFRLR